jgi:uncharacterized membrane protein YccC
MAKSKAKDGKAQVEELQAKVLRRSEKLAKSLRRLVAQSEPGRSPAQKLLKALESALPQMQQVAEATHPDGSGKVAPKRTIETKEAGGPRPGKAKQASKGKEPVAAPAQETAPA